MKITFVGDFKCDDISRLQLDNSLRTVLLESDTNVVNFEAPIKCDATPILKSGPCINQDAKAPLWLEDIGFNIVSLANNHAMDYGEDGLKITTDSFKTAQIVGVGTFAEAYKMRSVEKNGIKVGFLSASHCEFGVLKNIGEDSYGSAWICSPRIDELIVDCKKKVDFLILLPHAGVEYLDFPLPEWRELYRHYIKMGCDAVIASHPHVPQGYEVYNQKLISYSLGNFYFDLKSKCCQRFWHNGLIITLDIDKNKNYSFSVQNVINESSLLRIDESDNIQHHSTIINSYLKDDKKYYNLVNNASLKLLSFYENQFCRSGYVKSPFSIGFLKGIGDYFKTGSSFSKVHVLNNIQCESHRWFIERALRLKYNL